MAQTYLTAVSNGTRDAECLKADTDGSCCVGCSAAVFLDGDGCAYGVSPFCVLKADRLNAFDQLVNVNAGSLGDFLALFDGRDTLLLEASKNLRFSSFI